MYIYENNLGLKVCSILSVLILYHEVHCYSHGLYESHLTDTQVFLFPQCEEVIFFSNVD